MFKIGQGAGQHIRFVIEDMAGNITDTDIEEEYNSGKVANFVQDITVSTNVFIRIAANKPVLYGTVGGLVIAIMTTVGLVVYKRKKKNVK